MTEPCPHCQAQFIFKRNLREHIADAHSGPDDGTEKFYRIAVIQGSLAGTRSMIAAGRVSWNEEDFHAAGIQMLLSMVASGFQIRS